MQKTTEMGRPSKGRTERIQSMVTPVVKAYLEKQQQLLGETTSDVVFRLLEAASMGLREIVYTTGLTTKNRCKLIPDELVQEFLASCSPEAKEHYQQRPYEDRQLHAGWRLYHDYSLKEAERLGYQESDYSLIGREHWVIVAGVRGDDEGARIATQYGFDPLEVVKHGGDMKWGVIGWRREGDAVIFIGANEKIPENDYHVGVVWAPVDMVAKYQPDDPASGSTWD